MHTIKSYMWNWQFKSEREKEKKEEIEKVLDEDLDVARKISNKV